MDKQRECYKVLLSKLYLLRTVSYRQIRTYIYENYTKRYTDKILGEMQAEKLIKKCGYYNESAYFFITNRGIQYLREYGITDIGGKDTEVREDISAGDLSLRDVLVNHQLSLNEFVLKFEAEFTGDMKYYDEKYVCLLTKNIRPDGVLLYGGVYYFLEMDMNTERQTSLMKKWERYRYFLSSGREKQFNYPIRVLFIMGGATPKKTGRKYALWKYIYSNLADLTGENFDILIGTQDELFSYIRNENPVTSLMKKQGFTATTGKFKTGVLADYRFDGYCFLRNGDKIKSNEIMAFEFILDDLSYGSIYVIHKIACYDMIKSLSEHDYGREINYLVLLSSEKDAEKLVSLLGRCPVYFTTKKRLSTLPLNKAVFIINSSGEIYNFNNSWNRTVKEEKIEI